MSSLKLEDIIKIRDEMADADPKDKISTMLMGASGLAMNKKSYYKLMDMFDTDVNGESQHIGYIGWRPIMGLNVEQKNWLPDGVIEIDHPDGVRYIVPPGFGENKCHTE